ncbi:MAG: ChaN family lipoprotein [Gallionella sp.]
MPIKHIVVLVLTLSCTACGLFEKPLSGFTLPIPQSATLNYPELLDPTEPSARKTLVDRMADKRVLFIGEVHDSIGHHQNQLQLIQGMYARYPDMAIGVEYFQQPFQRYLDDYIAGRMSEKEMLKKTEYYERWKIDYRMVRPIFEFAREKRIPILALNVSEEIHNKVFKGGLNSLTPLERAEIPAEIKPANPNYTQRLQSIFNTHPKADNFKYFVDGVLLWDEAMADTAVRYLNARPQSKVVVLAGLVHILYGDGIPERVNRRLAGNQSVIAVNNEEYGQFANIADYALVTPSSKALPNTGKLGITLISDESRVHISEFAPASPAEIAGLRLGDHIVSLDGERVASLAELKAIMLDKKPRESMQVTVYRESLTSTNKELQFEVRLN